MYTEFEKTRRADFAECPILASYIATMLEDLQLSEADEAAMAGRAELDSGTIYTLEQSTYDRCKADCQRFYADNLADIEAADELIPGDDGLRYTTNRYMNAERVGSTFYLQRVGHGIAFTDDGNAPCLERLSQAARTFGHIDYYFGDDGEVYAI